MYVWVSLSGRKYVMNALLHVQTLTVSFGQWCAKALMVGGSKAVWLRTNSLLVHALGLKSSATQRKVVFFGQQAHFSGYVS